MHKNAFLVYVSIQEVLLYFFSLVHVFFYIIFTFFHRYKYPSFYAFKWANTYILKAYTKYLSILKVFFLVILLDSPSLNEPQWNHPSVPIMHNSWLTRNNLMLMTSSSPCRMPAFDSNGWYALFFIIFVILCMYIFVSIFLAVVYKNYRNHLKASLTAHIWQMDLCCSKIL